MQSATALAAPAVPNDQVANQLSVKSDGYDSEEKYAAFMAKYARYAKYSKRMNKELHDLICAPIPGVSIQLTENENLIWIIQIEGPEGTPFIGGVFTVCLDFRDNFPFKPPKINFETMIYHPSV